MSKSKKPQLSQNNTKSFKELTKTTIELAKNRSDGVAITAIVGLVISFTTLIIVAGCTFYIVNQSLNKNTNLKSTTRSILKV